MNNKRRRYYGWYIVVSCMVIVLLTNGMRMGIGPFINPVMADLGLSRTELSTIVAIGMIIYGVGMPIGGFLLKTFSTRFMMLSGLIIVCVSIIWSVNSIGFFSFLFSFGVFLSLGLSFLSNISLSPIISKWFVRQKGKALFFLSTGGMAGIAIITPLETWLIQLVGWQQTLLILAGLFILIVVPSAIFIMKEDVPQGADSTTIDHSSKKQEFPSPVNMTLSEAMRSKEYVKLVLGFFACGFGMNLLGSHAVPMLVAHGYEPMIASFGIGTIGFVAMFGSVILGQIADRLPRKNILFLVYFVRGLGLFALVFTSTNWQMFLVAIGAGLVWSGSIPMSTAILSDLFGVRLLSLLNGWAYFVHQIGGACASFLGGYFYEAFGSYLFSFSLAGALTLIASIVSITLPIHLSIQKNKPMKATKSF